MKEVIFIQTNKHVTEKNLEKQLEEKQQLIETHYIKERICYAFMVVYIIGMYYWVLDWNIVLFYLAPAVSLFYYRYKVTGKYHEENKQTFEEMKTMIDKNKKIKSSKKEMMKEIIHIREKADKMKFVIKVILVDMVAFYFLIRFFLL